MNDKKIKKLVYSALCLALCMVLPLITAGLQSIGNMLCPMHFPVLICGFICGWPYGLLVGAIAPILRFFIFGMPPLMPIGIPMAFELATYGFVSGLLYAKLKKTKVNIYVSLLLAMISGRVIWGIVKMAIAGISKSSFPVSAFIAGAITNAIPGIVLQIIIIPVIVMALRKTKVTK